jgi:hypothetical protein
MSVDPTDPETVEDAYEEEPEAELTSDDEVSAADAAEQQAELLQQRNVPIADRGDLEADPADAADQARVVELNEDEYR